MRDWWANERTGSAEVGAATTTRTCEEVASWAVYDNRYEAVIGSSTWRYGWCWWRSSPQRYWAILELVSLQEPIRYQKGKPLPRYGVIITVQIESRRAGLVWNVGQPGIGSTSLLLELVIGLRFCVILYTSILLTPKRLQSLRKLADYGSDLNLMMLDYFYFYCWTKVKNEARKTRH